MTTHTTTIPNGPGLRWLRPRERWYGGGFCGLCGSEDIIPTACRWFDPDDGWRMGTLCAGCADEARERGPQPDDLGFSLDTETKSRIDLGVQYGDLDSTYADDRDRDL